jgi:hypothetical protein
MIPQKLFLDSLAVPAIFVSGSTLAFCGPIARLAFFEKAIIADAGLEALAAKLEVAPIRVCVAMPIEDLIALRNMLDVECGKIEVERTKQ